MLKRVEWVLLLVGFLTCLAVKSETKDLKNWTLQELLSHTIENAPAITKARLNNQYAKLEEAKIKSLFWPKVKFESTLGFRNQEPTPYSISEYSALAINLSENLWNQGLDRKKLSLARLATRTSELQYFQIRDEVCLNVTQEYYRYSQLVKSLEIQRNQHRLLKKQFDLVSNEYLHGLRSRRDFLRFKSQSQRAELDLQKQVTQIEKSRLNLLALAGFGASTEGQQFKPEDSPPPMLDLFRNPAELDNTYEDQLLALASQSSELNREVAIKQLTPDISFDLKASTQSGNFWNTGYTLQSQRQNTWGAYLAFNWTLWDGGEEKAKEAQINVQNEIQKSDLRQRKINLQAEIQKLQKQFLLLKENFKTSEEFLILEQNNFLFIEGEYRQSKSTYLDFINGMKDLAEAQNRHWSNLYDLKQGIALYHYYKGSLFRFLLNDYVRQDDQNTEEL
jgi:outer membrane protein TolC